MIHEKSLGVSDYETTQIKQFVDTLQFANILEEVCEISGMKFFCR